MFNIDDQAWQEVRTQVESELLPQLLEVEREVYCAHCGEVCPSGQAYVAHRGACDDVAEAIANGEFLAA